MRSSAIHNRGMLRPNGRLLDAPETVNLANPELNVSGKIVLALRNLLPSLALLCFAIGAFTPIGLMPGSVADGTPFVLCPQQNPALAELLTSDVVSGDHQHQHQHNVDSSSTSGTDKCSFASAASTFIVSDVTMDIMVAEKSFDFPTGTQAPIPFVRSSSRSARGPPAAVTI